MLGRGQHKDRLDTSVHGPVSLSDSTFVFKIGRRPQAPDNDVGIHLPAKIYGQTEIRFYRHPIGIFKSLSNQTNTTIRIEKFLLNGIDTDSNNNLIEQFQAPSYDLFMPDRKRIKGSGKYSNFFHSRINQFGKHSETNVINKRKSQKYCHSLTI